LTEQKTHPRSNCPLCRLYEQREISTRFYYENALVIIVDCLTCSIPMVVLKRHTDNPSREDIKEMYWALLNKVPKRMHGKGWQIDSSVRSIPDHPHFHLRPTGK